MSDEVMATESLMNACRKAATQEALTTALEELKASILIPSFQETYREELASSLIRGVVILGPAASRAFDRCLDAIGILATLSACSQTFLEAARVKMESQHSLETSLLIVRRLILTVPDDNDALWVRQLEETCNTSAARRDLMIRATMDSIVTMTLLLPSQIANACHHQRLHLPAWCVRTRYMPRLVECALIFEQKSKSLEASLYVQIIIQKIVHSGGSDEVAFALYHYYHHSNDGPYEAAVLKTMLQISTPRECATLLRSILRHLTAEVEYEYSPSQTLDMFCRERLLPYLKAVCGPVLEASKDVRESFVQLTILSSSSTGVGTKSDRVLCHCVALLLAACEADEDESSDEEEEEIGVFNKRPSVLRRHLNEVAKCWSETVFVQHTDMSLQLHVTHFLLSAISMLGNNDKVEASSRLALTLVNGVSVRLAASLDEIRKDGMRVAELLASRMDNPLRFEELDDEREIDGVAMADISTEEPPKKEKEVIRKKGRGVNKKRASRRRAAKPIDPDSEYASDQDSDSSQTDDGTDNDSDFQGDEDSVWDDDEPLIPYNLDDDEEDLRVTPTPLYLRQCLDMLRTLDTEDAAWSRHESALGAMSPLIRSNPADLPDLTVPLCKAILDMENKFDLPDFDVHTEAGLLSLAVMQPVLAGEYLIENFFSSCIGLSTRLSVLHTLESAACELCGAKALEAGRRELASERESLGQKVSGKRRLVAESTTGKELQANIDRSTASDESRTRRWGKGGRQAKPLTVVNSFGTVAPNWFYALVSGFVKHKEDTSLWAGANGARLLASFLVALATIAECSGLAPGTEILAQDLIELAWSFRTVEVPEVRIAVLVAIANSLALLRDEALISVLYGHGELPGFLRVVALEDSNETCRMMAATLSKNVSQILGSVVHGSRSLQY